jgi:hypothetical protein
MYTANTAILNKYSIRGIACTVPMLTLLSGFIPRSLIYGLVVGVEVKEAGVCSTGDYCNLECSGCRITTICHNVYCSVNYLDSVVE